MIRRVVCGVVLCLGLLGQIPLVQAWTEKGELQVMVDFEDDRVHDCEISIYKVAERSEEDYKLLQSLGGGLVKSRDVQSPVLAKWLVELIEGEGIPRILDADGIAYYTGLDDGLYLITQGKWDSLDIGFDPILVPIPYMGSMIVGVKPKMNQLITESPKTGDYFSPLVAAMGIVLCSLAIGACIEKLNQK